MQATSIDRGTSTHTIRPQGGRARAPQMRFDQRTERVALILQQALRHFQGAERNELLETALLIQTQEIYR